MFQSCLTLCNPIDGSPPGSPIPGILHWRMERVANTGVGCHFLLQCMKVKSESKVAQLSPTLSDPMDCSIPGSSIHGIFQARVLEWDPIAFSEETGVTGKFGLGVQNEAEQRLTEFCQQNALVIANTLFQQTKRRLYTWTSPDGQH